MFTETNRALIIIEALLMGIRINIGGRTYCLSDQYELCVPPAADPDRLLKVNFGDVDLLDYVTLARDATEEEIIYIAANIGLNKPLPIR